MSLINSQLSNSYYFNQVIQLLRISNSPIDIVKKIMQIYSMRSTPIYHKVYACDSLFHSATLKSLAQITTMSSYDVNTFYCCLL